MSGLWLRIATGVGIVLIIMLGTLRDATTFFIVFGGIAALCLVEFTKIVYHENPKNTANTVRRIFGIGLGLMPLLWMISFLSEAIVISNSLFFIGVVLLFFLMMIFELFVDAPQPIQNLAYTGLGMVYIGLPFALLFYLQSFYEPSLVLGIILLVFMNDSLAYLVGSRIGKTPLFPRISPKKTWEGILGGSVFTFILAASYSFIFYQNEPFHWEWIVAALLIVIFGPIGDLTESMIKRNFKIKDSSSILPGHGGFLDRFDAFIFVIPFVTFYFLLILQ